MELEIDVRNVAAMGLSAARFPASCVEAYEELCRQSGVSIDPGVVEKVRAAANAVFTAKAELVPDAESILRSLRSKNRIALLTQGDEVVQRKRIDDSGLESLFDAVSIVPAKSVGTLRTLLAELDADPETSWFVGNSIPSDINPAVACGMRAIWIDAHVWDHERRETPFADDRIVALPNLALVPKLIDG